MEASQGLSKGQRFSAIPEGSGAILAGRGGIAPFEADRAGDCQIELRVNDGQAESARDAVAEHVAAPLVTDTLLFYKNSSLTSLNVLDRVAGEFIAAIPLGRRRHRRPDEL